MLMSRNCHKVKEKRRIDHGRALANARGAKHRREVADYPLSLPDANRVRDFLEARGGEAAFTNERVDHTTREAVTWVKRFSRKARVSQFDCIATGISC